MGVGRGQGGEEESSGGGQPISCPGRGAGRYEEGYQMAAHCHLDGLCGLDPAQVTADVLAPLSDSDTHHLRQSSISGAYFCRA